MPQCRAWIELSLQDHLIPTYPFRVEPYSMIGQSPYANQCRIEDARFKIRLNIFNIEEIEQDLDPSYDRLGNFKILESVDELMEFLNENNLTLEDFIDASSVEEYPL
ncbi:hypothetical protein A6E19_10530 [Pseudomonas putida]|nr:hypothetical protein A6E24_12745 [Pseudomonas putida]OCT28121.1 hypothetical protein A6E23_09185 [Pseudomonas putida]OCT32598.1 hypothetical protein A6E20_01970 [Pseudomonas putida]OCT39122.1 hypothetical protein A6E19_10530 [Pseudomonas putida]